MDGQRAAATSAIDDVGEPGETGAATPWVASTAAFGSAIDAPVTAEEMASARRIGGEVTRTIAEGTRQVLDLAREMGARFEVTQPAGTTRPDDSSKAVTMPRLDAAKAIDDQLRHADLQRSAKELPRHSAREAAAPTTVASPTMERVNERGASLEGAPLSDDSVIRDASVSANAPDGRATAPGTEPRTIGRDGGLDGVSAPAQSPTDAPNATNTKGDRTPALEQERTKTDDDGVRVVREVSNAAPHAVDLATGGSKPTDGVTTASHDKNTTRTAGEPTTDEAREQRQTHAEVAVSRMTLRSGMKAEAVLPELGRVSVDARARGDVVDLRLTADRAETAAILEGHRSEMRSDLGRSHVEVADLSVGVGAGSNGSSSQGSRESHRESARSSVPSSKTSSPRVELSQNEVAAAQIARQTRRVRIVL